MLFDDPSLSGWGSEEEGRDVVIDTGSQVCCLAWNPHLNKELLSAHGYSENHLFCGKGSLDPGGSLTGRASVSPIHGP